jgi:hypothetical protein
MKFELTQQAAAELEAISKRIDDAGDDNYEVVCESLNERELLVCDAGMYVDGAYEENEFDDLNKWCLSTGNMEYNQTYLNTNPNAVREKINTMLREGLIELTK